MAPAAPRDSPLSMTNPQVQESAPQARIRLWPTLTNPKQMTDERKYQEEEVREIFDLAANEAKVGRPAISDEGGLTLLEIQEVGLEVGMEPARIAEAAFVVDARREILPRRTYFRVPTSVGRIVDLPRALTDHEWDVLVGELRETFGARGTVTSQRGAREWTNGNLHAFLEPTATGHRLRLGTLKGNAVALITEVCPVWWTLPQ